MLFENPLKHVITTMDQRGVITLGGVDTMKRHDQYGYSLKTIPHNTPLRYIVLTSKDGSNLAKNNHHNLEYFQISKSTYNSVVFAIRSYFILKRKRLFIELFVTDPWEGYWSTYFLKRFLSQKTPIQIQLHGDIANPLWRKINLRNQFRYHLARFSVPRVDSIRVVSKHQAELVIKHFRIDKDRIEVIPVPISNLNLIPKSLSKIPKTLGFFGRIHQDRGIWEFIKLIRKLNMQTQDFKLIIAGDGPDKERFLGQLYEILPKSRISYLGHIPEKELCKVWRRVGVLVSLAPVESYGRVMREALVAGVPVWAKSSSGVRDLMDKCEKGTVKIIDLNMSASDLSREFEVLLETKVGPKFAKEFIKENDTYAEKLAQSWIKTINKSKRA